MNAEKMREKEVYLKFEESQPNKTKRNKTKQNKKMGKVISLKNIFTVLFQILSDLQTNV